MDAGDRRVPAGMVREAVRATARPKSRLPDNGDERAKS